MCSLTQKQHEEGATGTSCSLLMLYPHPNPGAETGLIDYRCINSRNVVGDCPVGVT